MAGVNEGSNRDEEGTLDYGGVLPLSSGPGPSEISPQPPTEPHAHRPPSGNFGSQAGGYPHSSLLAQGGLNAAATGGSALPPTQPHSHLPAPSGFGLHASSGFGATPTGLSHSLDESASAWPALSQVQPPTSGVSPELQSQLVEDEATTVRLVNYNLDRSGYDTHLARFLGKIGRLNVQTLQAALVHARAERQEGVTLARALVSHGHLSQDEAVAFLRHVSTIPALEESGEYDAQTVARAPAGSSILYGDGWATGDRIGNYQLLEKLGAGGMGVVYKARDVTTGRPVAIKTLTPIEDPEFLARFRREGQAQARLDHPNLVRVHSWGERNQRPYLVMDFVEGKDLQELLREGRFEAREAARITRDVASAVAHLHQTGVLHRDLKPSNILIDQQGRPRLVDFGVARLEGAETLTRTGDILGTPAFMSPEQALGERESIGPKTDVYSLCAVLYNLLTGSAPFRGASAVTMLTKVVQEEPPPPRVVAGDIPEDLEAICLRGMSKDPNERFTAAALAEVLDRFLSGERLDPKERRAGRAQGGMILAFVLFVGGLGLGLWGRQQDRPAQATSPTPNTSAAPSQPTASASSSPEEPVASLSAPPLQFSSKVQTFELEVSTDITYSQYGTDRSTLDMKNLLTMAWRARKLESGHWSIDAEIESLVVDWGWVQNGNSAIPPMHYDSRRAKTGAFSAALGRRFSFDLDPKTGDVHNLYGVAAIQSAVLEAAGQDAARHRTPVFRPAALENLLESLFRGPTDQLSPGEWKLVKEPPSIIGGGGGDGGDAERESTGLKRNRPPPVELTYTRRRGTLDQVEWAGRSASKLEPYTWTSRPKGKPTEELRVESSAKREVVGRAFFDEEGIPSVLELNETVKTLRVFSASGGELQAPTESKSVVKLRRRE